MNNPHLRARKLSFFSERLQSELKAKFGGMAATIERIVNVQHRSVLPAISMLLASVSMLMILFWPKFMMSEGGQVNHGYLTWVLLANSAAFIHGIGYKPETFIWRVLFTPMFAWPLLFSFFIYVYQGI